MFPIADFFAWIGAGGAIFYLVVSFLTLLFLSLSDFMTNSVFSDLVVRGWLGLLIEIVIAAFLLLGFYLHIKRQVFGVAFILVGLAIRGVVLSYQLGETQLVALAMLMVAAVFVVPWTWVYFEAKSASHS